MSKVLPPALKLALEQCSQHLTPNQVLAFSQQQLAAVISGIHCYQSSTYSRALPAAPVIWQEGCSRVLDYGVFCPDVAHAKPLLVIPSLVNKAYILDLSSKRSFLRYLCRQGWRPLLVEWDSPTGIERDFTLTDYIAGRLDMLLHQLPVSGAIPVLGYCMGGMLALAMAQRQPQRISRLVLLATPWDFTPASSEGQRQHLKMLRPMLDTILQQQKVLPVDLLQTLLASTDMFGVCQRYMALADIQDTQTRGHLVAIEDWLNDGIDLAAPVARECLFDWYLHNLPATGQWRVAGQAILPQRIQQPVLLVNAARDRIVPVASSQMLSSVLPCTETLTPNTGHIGMVVGRNAHTAMWQPVNAWLGQ